jgi:hypothetical protein
MARLGRALLATAITVVVLFGAKLLPNPASRLPHIPGTLVAAALGGSFDSPGHVSQETTITVIVAVSALVWGGVTYWDLEKVVKGGAA